MDEGTTNGSRIRLLAIADLVIVVVCLHVLGVMFGEVYGPTFWPVTLVRAFQYMIPSIYDIDVDPLYGSIRAMAIFWLWLSFFRSIVSAILMLMKQKPLFANNVKQLLIGDAVAALFVVPLYVR